MTLEDLLKNVLKTPKAVHLDTENPSDAYAKALSVQAAKILEEFQWNNDAVDEEVVGEALAELIGYVLVMADSLDFDLEALLKAKLEVDSRLIK